MTPETREFWASAADGDLSLSECQNCGLVYYYPRALCPDCFSDDVTGRSATGEGEVYSYSVTRTISGWPEDDLPLVVAYVELDEGVRMMTNVHADPDDVAVGTRVEVTFVDTEEPDVAIPVFVPVTDGESDG
ncbi:OB-fold domain-containing protein [Halorubellus sp. JP-L1]|uniref:Zn-ribbon domain-containing OB-fold protein n=1 Tax=Halorubellus sp. JP-L1 TaxID=2715753 RepID=UPI001966B8AC